MTSTPPAATPPAATSSRSTTPGAVFGAMLKGALLPSVVAGGLAVAGMTIWRGAGALPGALLGWAVSVVFFAVGMLLMSRLVRNASPHAFFAIAMTVYLGQVIGLLLFLIAFHGASWVDGRALGLVALVVTIVWQVFAMRAMRRARVLVYDPPEEDA